MKVILSFCALSLCVAASRADEFSQPVQIVPGFQLIANPLVGNNGLPSTVIGLSDGPLSFISSIPEGSIFFKFDNAKGFSSAQFQFGNWSNPEMTLQPGEGAYFFNPTTNTFTIILHGNPPATAPAPTIYNGWQIISFPIATSQNWPVPIEADKVGFFDTVTQKLIYHTYDGLEARWIPPLPPIGVTQSVFYQRLHGTDNPAGRAPNGGAVFVSNYLPSPHAGTEDFPFLSQIGCGLEGDGFRAAVRQFNQTTGRTEQVGPVFNFLTGRGAGYITATNMVVYANPTNGAGWRFAITNNGSLYYDTSFQTVFSSQTPNPPRFLPRFTLPFSVVQLTISKQPLSQLLRPGGALRLETAASPATNVTFQWHVQKPDGDWQVIPGATNSSYLIDSASPSDSGNYVATLSRECRILTTRTAFVEVSVEPRPFANLDFESAVLPNDSPLPATLDWAAAVPGWQHSEFADVVHVAARPNALGCFYALYSDTHPTNLGTTGLQLGGKYSLEIANGRITNNGSFKLVANYVSQVGFIPDWARWIELSANLDVHVYVADIQIPLHRSTGLRFSGDISAFAGKGYELKIVAASSIGLVLIDDIRFSAATRPVPTKQPISRTIAQGHAVTFSVEHSTVDVQYQWRINGRDIPGATGSTYTIDRADDGHVGYYDVVLTNPAGTETSERALLGFTELRIFAGLIITGPIGSTYTIESSLAAEGAEWTPIGGFTLQLPRDIWIDQNLPTQKKLFYRAVPVP